MYAWSWRRKHAASTRAGLRGKTRRSDSWQDLVRGRCSLDGARRQILFVGAWSPRAAWSKRRALAFIFPIRIWYVFWGSKCRGESDLGLCTTLGLVKRMSLRSTDFRQILRPNTFLNRKSALRSRILLACQKPKRMRVPKLCTDLDRTLLYIPILKTYSKFARENKTLRLSGWCLLPADMHERWPHACRVKITFTLLRTNCFASTTTHSMKCRVTTGFHWESAFVREIPNHTFISRTQRVMPPWEPRDLAHVKFERIHVFSWFTLNNKTSYAKQ